MVVWPVGSPSLWGSAKLCQHTLGERGLQDWAWTGEDGVVDGEQRGNKWSRCLHEKGAARWPLGTDKEKDESK